MLSIMSQKIYIIPIVCIDEIMSLIVQVFITQKIVMTVIIL